MRGNVIIILLNVVSIFVDEFEVEKKTVDNEIAIHRRLSHCNIVKYFTTRQIDMVFLQIFMEYVE